MRELWKNALHLTWWCMPKDALKHEGIHDIAEQCSKYFHRLCKSSLRFRKKRNTWRTVARSFQFPKVTRVSFFETIWAKQCKTLGLNRLISWLTKTGDHLHQCPWEYMEEYIHRNLPEIMEKVAGICRAVMTAWSGYFAERKIWRQWKYFILLFHGNDLFTTFTSVYDTALWRALIHEISWWPWHYSRHTLLLTLSQ